jgi:hypothetical protein
VRRRLVIGTAALVVLAIAAVVVVLLGRNNLPSVTFASATSSVTTGPTQYCDLKVTHCDNHPDAVATLALPAGQPLQITVPADVSATPWQVVFSYLPRAGASAATQLDARSPVFAPNQQSHYTLELPAPTDQLVTAQVQQYGGGQPTIDANGDPAFPIRASWVLDTPAP